MPISRLSRLWKVSDSFSLPYEKGTLVSNKRKSVRFFSPQRRFRGSKAIGMEKACTTRKQVFRKVRFESRYIKTKIRFQRSHFITMTTPSASDDPDLVLSVFVSFSRTNPPTQYFYYAEASHLSHLYCDPCNIFAVVFY